MNQSLTGTTIKIFKPILLVYFIVLSPIIFAETQVEYQSTIRSENIKQSNHATGRDAENVTTVTEVRSREQLKRESEALADEQARIKAEAKILAKANAGAEVEVEAEADGRAAWALIMRVAE